MLLTGPFGGLTDDVREFLRCLDGDGLLLTGWGELDPASLRTVRERLPGGDGPDGLALARRRTTLLRSLCDAGRLTEADAGMLQLTELGREFLDLPDAAQLGFVFAAWWEGVDWGDWAPRPELGRLLWHERDALLQELAGLPPGQVDLAGFAHRFRVLVGHRWPSVAAAADAGEWRQALWSTALAPWPCWAPSASPPACPPSRPGSPSPAPPRPCWPRPPPCRARSPRPPWPTPPATDRSTRGACRRSLVASRPTRALSRGGWSRWVGRRW